MEELVQVYLSTKMDNLLDGSSTGQVGHGPGGLLLGLEVSLDEDIDQRLETSCVNDHLNLLVIARGDVGDGPGAIFGNILLGMLQKLGKDRDSLMLENSVSLRVVACHDVT